MHFKNHNYILKISIFFGYIFSILFFLSGDSHDAINYLNQRGGTQLLRFSADRTDLTFLLIYPFSLFGVTIGGILYISLFSLLVNYILKRIQSIRQELDFLNSKYSITDFFILYPYYFQSIVIPGKESIVFLCISSIYFICYKINRSIESTKKIKNIQIYFLFLSILIAVLLRPPIIFLLPASLFFSFPNLSKMLYELKFKNKFNLKKLLIFLLLIVFILTSITILLFAQELIKDGLIGILKSLAYDKGKTTTGNYNYYSIADNFNEFIPLSISAFIFGFPTYPTITSNKLSIFIGSTFFFTNTYIYFFLIKKYISNIYKNLRVDFIHLKELRFNISKVAINVLLILIFLFGAYILSLGLTINTGTGMRYAFPYFQIIWLTQIFSNSSESKKKRFLK